MRRNLHVQFGGRLAATMALIAALLLPQAKAVAGSYEFVLGPADRIHVKIVEWRPGRNSEVYEWSALNGDYVIGASGSLSMPLLGDVPAKGLTPAQLKHVVSDRLQSVANLVVTPDTSLEVTQYRPIYVTGFVEHPGEQAFRPGLTIVKAVSIAGGLYRSPELSGWQAKRDRVSGFGTIRLLEQTRDTLLARHARLQAQVTESALIDFSPEIRDSRWLEAAGVLKAEHDILDADRASRAAQIESNRKKQDLLEKEIVSLQTKADSLTEEFQSLQKEFGGVASLVEKGLTISARQLAVEHSLSQVTQARLDTQTAILRARLEIASGLDTVAQLQAKRQAEAIESLQATSVKLAEVKQQQETALRLLATMDARLAQAAARENQPISSMVGYHLTREGPSSTVDVAASENTELQPGDVLDVVGPQLFSDDDRIAPLSSRLSTPGRFSSLPNGIEERTSALP